MQTRTYQLFASASQANAANVTIIAPGYIHGICWAAILNSVVDNDSLYAELSFQSVLQNTTNNATGIIDVLAIYNNFVTSGLSGGQVNKECMGMYIPVGIGQIIYLNTVCVGAYGARALMHVIEK